MTHRRVTIGVPDGVHARPVAQLARLAQQHATPVTLTTASGEEVDVSSVLALMDLGLNPGDTVTLRAEGSDADDLLDALSAVLAPRH